MFDDEEDDDDEDEEAKGDTFGICSGDIAGEGGAD